MSALGCLLGWMGLISKLNGLPSISCIEMALVCSNLPQRFFGHNLAAHIDLLTAQVQFVLLQAPQSSVVVAEESVFSTVWTLHNIQMQEFVQRMSAALPQIVQQLFHVSSVLEPSRHLPLAKRTLRQLPESGSKLALLGENLNWTWKTTRLYRVTIKSKEFGLQPAAT